MLRSLFLDHPASVEESYFTHQRHAFSFGREMIVAGIACFIHGLIPRFFETRGSRTIVKLHGRMVVNRRAVVPGGEGGKDQ